MKNNMNNPLRSVVSKILLMDPEKIYDYDIKILKTAYKLENYNNIELIKYIIFKTIFDKDTKILNFARRCGEEYFDKNRYIDYYKYKLKNPNDSGSEIVFKFLYGDDWKIKYATKNRNNPYDVNYVMTRDNISKDDAIKLIDEIKKHKSMTLDGFILRDGLELGTKKFKKFQETSNIFSLENLKRKYGDDAENKLKEYKKKNKETSIWRPEYWMKKYNCSIDVAKQYVSNFQKYNSGISYDAILLRCNNDKYMADEIYQMINLKKDSKSYQHCLDVCNNNHESATILYNIKKKQSDNTSLKYFMDLGYTLEESIQKQKEKKNKEYLTRIENGTMIPEELYGEYVKYCKKVKYFTLKNITVYSHLINKKTKINNTIDHKISKMYGFKNNIDEYIIGHIMNLEYITSSKNSSKNIKNSQTLEELKNKILFFEKNNITIK